MTEQHLALAVNGRENRLVERLTAFSQDARDASGPMSVAVVGLGYVGLPTACALRSPGARTVGLDVSHERLRDVAVGEVDLPEDDRRALQASIQDGDFRLTADESALSEVDAVIVCVPTPVDDRRQPDLSSLRRACAGVVEHAHRGQTIVLSSTTFAGTTRELLIEPLAERGLAAGRDVFVAFSPERIDPGNLDHVPRRTPRIVGGATAACADRAGSLIGRMTDAVYLVGSPEAAELTKLYENVFRAVNLALANEVADICSGLGLDPVEVTLAAGTKPYGFLGSLPGPGVGGHCIPCDPHYLLWQLRRDNLSAPLIEEAMRAIENRPMQVVRRVGEVLAAAGAGIRGARVLLVGVSYKSGVRDVRESPAIPIMTELVAAGARVGYHDPLVPEVELADGTALRAEAQPDAGRWDLVVVHTVHPGVDYAWVRDCPRILDATYQFDIAEHRQLV